MKKAPEGAWFKGASVTSITTVAAITTTIAATATAAAIAGAGPIGAAETAVAPSATAVTAAAIAATTTVATAAAFTATAVATTTAATAAIATTTATKTTAAGWAGFHGAGFIDDDGTATQGLTIHAVDGRLRFGIAGHFHKAEAFGAAGVALPSGPVIALPPKAIRYSGQGLAQGVCKQAHQAKKGTC